MKKAFLSLFAIHLVDFTLFGAACCGGGGPKSFIQLQELQSTEIGISTSFKDTYARYDSKGIVREAEKEQAYTVSLGAGTRLTPNLESFVIVPFRHQSQSVGLRPLTATGLGDISAGFRYVLVRSLYQFDWYPSVTLLSGIKLPTGSTKPLLLGTGIWEPAFGLEFSKSLRPIILTFTSSYTLRLSKDSEDFTGARFRLDEGDRIDLTVAGQLSLSQRLSIGMGAVASWDGPVKMDGKISKGSEARLLGAFGNLTYFLDRFWSVSASLDHALNMGGFGKNQQASRGVSITSSVAFY